MVLVYFRGKYLKQIKPAFTGFICKAYKGVAKFTDTVVDRLRFCPEAFITKK